MDNPLTKLQDENFRKAARELLGIVRLMKFGGSYALILPKYWVEYCCYETPTNDEDGYAYWAQVEEDENGNQIIKPLSKTRLEELLQQLEKKEASK